MTTFVMGENADGTMMTSTTATPEQLKMQAALMTRADPEGGQMPMTMADPEGGGGIGAGIGAINTLAVGEQGGSILNPGGGGGNFGPPNMATLAIPENGGFNPQNIMSTQAVGEQGGDLFRAPTTRMLGEQGDMMPPSHHMMTQISPENGSGTPPLQRLPGAGVAMTLAFPENGGGIGGGMPPLNMPGGGMPPILTQAAGEDGRPENPLNPSTMPGQNPFDFSTFKSDLLTGIGDLFKKYFDETSSPFGGNEITPPPAPGEKKPATSPGDLVAPSSNYGSLASKGMQSPFRGL